MTRSAAPRANVGDHADMVAAIIEVYGRADDAQRVGGRTWYGTAGRMVRTMAADTRTPADRVALALAALSPRNPWRWNVADCYAFTVAASADPAGPVPSATTFTVNRERAWSALTTGAAPWATSAPKVRAFVAAILGDHGAVVVDTWAIRVATRGILAEVRDAEYGPVAAAYRDAAIMVGETPADVQAITWIVAQSEGLASARRGRHDQTFKRGTAPAVVAMFEASAESESEDDGTAGTNYESEVNR